MWLAWRDKGVLPLSGGWLDQPLEYLVNFRIIEQVALTFARKGTVNWAEFSEDERTLIKWLMNSTPH